MTSSVLWTFALLVAAAPLLLSAPALYLAICILTALWHNIFLRQPSKYRGRTLLLQSAFLSRPPPPTQALGEDEVCLICRSPFEDDVAPLQLPCSHIVCDECAPAWFDAGRNRCPYCREVLYTAPMSGTEMMLRASECLGILQAGAVSILKIRMLRNGYEFSNLGYVIMGAGSVLTLWHLHGLKRAIKHGGADWWRSRSWGWRWDLASLVWTSVWSVPIVWDLHCKLGGWSWRDVRMTGRL